MVSDQDVSSDAPKATPVTEEAKLAREGFRRAKNDRVWDWLRDVHVNVKKYMSSPAVVLPFLNDPQLTTNIMAKGRTAELANLVNMLTVDMRTYVERLTSLHAKHSARRGSSSGPDDLLNSITLGQEYMRFMASYESVVIVHLDQILEIFQQAGLDTTSIRATTDGQLVYDMYKADPSSATDA